MSRTDNEHQPEVSRTSLLTDHADPLEFPRVDHSLREPQVSSQLQQA
jgi:hypothetical protein